MLDDGLLRIRLLDYSGNTAREKFIGAEFIPARFRHDKTNKGRRYERQ